MAIYIAQLAAICILQPLTKRRVRLLGKKKQGEVVYLQIVILILFLLMALRGRAVGTDTFTYLNMYRRIMSADSFPLALRASSISSAPAYVGYLFLMSRITQSMRLMMFANSAIICLGLYNIIRSQSQNYFLSIYLFITLTLYYESMNGTRQFMAIVMAINAYIILRNNYKSVWGWLLFILAICTHITVVAFAIIFIGDLIANKVKTERKIMLITIVVSILVSLMFGVIVNIMLKLFPAYVSYTNGYFSSQIFDNQGSGRIALLYVALLLILIYSGWNINKIEKNSNLNSYYFACVFCAVSGILFSRNVLFNRILWPFLCCFIIYLPNAYVLIKARGKKMVYIVLGITLLVYCILHLYEDKSSIIPYSTYL